MLNSLNLLGLGWPDGAEREGLGSGDAGLTGKYEGDNGFAGGAGVEAAGDAEAAVEEDLYDGVVDEEVEAGLGGESFGHLDGDAVDEKGARRLVLIGADLDERADGVDDAVREWIADGGVLKDATELLPGIGQVGGFRVGGDAEALGLGGRGEHEVVAVEGEGAG